MTVDGPSLPDLRGIANSLATRIREIAAAQERSSSFVRSPAGGAALEGSGGGDLTSPSGLTAAARDLVVRLCRTLGVPANVELLALLAASDRGDAELAGQTGLDALVLWERVNELIQVGLARRDLSAGRVGLTSAGVGIAEIGQLLLAAVEQQLTSADPLPAVAQAAS
ncbi:MAG: hypothetical protein ACYDB7_06725 [Mycobacteriales bacterium]